MNGHPIDRPWGQPPYGPLDEEPVGIGRVEAIAMLHQATSDLPLGSYDRRVLVWVTTWSTGTVAAIASLLTRTSSTTPGPVVVGQVLHTSATARPAPVVQSAAAPAPATHEGVRP